MRSSKLRRVTRCRRLFHIVRVHVAIVVHYTIAVLCFYVCSVSFSELLLPFIFVGFSHRRFRHFVGFDCSEHYLHVWEGLALLISLFEILHFFCSLFSSFSSSYPLSNAFLFNFRKIFGFRFDRIMNYELRGGARSMIKLDETSDSLLRNVNLI